MLKVFTTLRAKYYPSETLSTSSTEPAAPIPSYLIFLNVCLSLAKVLFFLVLST